MAKYEYRISCVRYDNEKFEKKIDQILITIAHSKREACDILERLITEAGFKHVDELMKRLRNKKWDRLTSHCSLTGNLHGNLGPGGYQIEKRRAG